jgi:hypothetical protein
VRKAVRGMEEVLPGRRLKRISYWTVLMPPASPRIREFNDRVRFPIAQLD